MSTTDYPAVFVIDPPWPSPKQLPGQSSASDHYELMTMDDIKMAVCMATLDYSSVVVFMWRLSMFQVEAYDVLREAGLKPKDDIVWEKMTKNGKRHYGMGRYTKKSHETCILATRGKGVLPHGPYVRSSFEAKVREHSRKPEEFYILVETMYPNSPKFELFARTVRPGWQQSGNELNKFGEAV